MVSIKNCITHRKLRAILFLVCMLSLFSNSSNASNDEIESYAKISEATVFLRGARLTYNTSANIPAGRSALIVKGLPYRFDVNSLVVSVGGNATLLSVLPRASSKEPIDDKRFTALDDTLKKLRREHLWLLQQKSMLDAEENVLNANQSLGNTNVSFTANELKLLLDFYRIKINDIRLKKFENEAKDEKLAQQIAKVNEQLNEIRGRNKLNSTDLEIQFISKSAGINNLTIDLMVNEARWEPVYEIRSKSTLKEVNLGIRANVFQQTGQNWDKIPLTLSTSQNNVRGNRLPILNPSYVTIYQPQPVAKYNRQAYSNAPQVAASYDEGAEVAMKATGKVKYEVNTTSTPLSVEYEIVLPQSITSGTRANQVIVEDIKLPATFSYRSIPKLDKAVFLVGGITNWGSYNLLPAEASVFLENNYMGKTYIDPSAVSDTLFVPFGNDARINVSRTRLTDYTKKRFLGTNASETFGYEITVKNNNTNLIELIIEDQIPISTGSDIEITVEKLDGALYDKETGKLTWKIEAKPGQSKKLTFVFTVKYPKDKNIIVN